MASLLAFIGIIFSFLLAFWSVFIWESILWLLFFDIIIGYHYFTTSNLYMNFGPSPFSRNGTTAMISLMGSFILNINILLAPIAHIYTLILKNILPEEEAAISAIILSLLYFFIIWILDLNILFNYMKIIGF